MNSSNNQFIEENDQIRVRQQHLEEIRAIVGNAYPNKFVRSNVAPSAEGEDTVSSVLGKYKDKEPSLGPDGKPAPETLEVLNSELRATTVRISGRIATPPRTMGKAAFVHLSDGKERHQIYVRKAEVAAVNNNNGLLIEEQGSAWELFRLLDHGDFIGIEGFLFVTKTGELSVHVTILQFLSKALLPMPDKMHGIADPEIRQRQRYADLIAGSLKVERTEGELNTREVFERRALVIREMRAFLDAHGYIEVETPMLAPKATGAVAKPFVTHHNALDIPLFARIAPELYLKRLLVGGFERVYELNRNFRNEGLSTRHNPEFTMLEFYCAYMDVNGMMDFCEELLIRSARQTMEPAKAIFGNLEIDFESKFERVTMDQAVRRHWRSGAHQFSGEDVDSVLLTRRLDEVFEAVAEWMKSQSCSVISSGSRRVKRAALLTRPSRCPYRSSTAANIFTIAVEPGNSGEIRVVHRWNGGRKRLFRAKRSSRTTCTLRRSDEAARTRRRRSNAARRGLHPRPVLWYAARGRYRHWYRSNRDVAHRQAKHSRRYPVPAHAPRTNPRSKRTD